MNWIDLSNEAELETIKQESTKQPVVIFKHSTRCSISVMVKNRLDKAEQPAGVKFYYLDLLQHRSISNKIADDFQVHHESPQVLLIKNGECKYEESHNGIFIEDITEQVA